MQILNLTPASDLGRRSRNTLLARFDVKITDEILIKNMMLKRRPDGALRSFSPHWQGSHVVSMAPEFAARVTAAAEAAFRGLMPDGA